ncbi:uncharacterized protein RCC_01701 [Ramularia collo-cygni]|uniref:Uncharacterized protein n=1 Tax=Ramularia collo-cygni TaxID=112498 RepID=A0A2D3V6C7_9PEZI|nr:uncharacterized protein RCC_01701 [Ramularia collo-cygni]CZT15863.1 uncharacterized protein RCC_01701 [Ramularia collo-cygni]
MTTPLSPGNAYFTHVPNMRLPSMDFIYRLECEMSKDEQIIGKSSVAQVSRAILPISGGTVLGPRISATILNTAGADWATTLAGDRFYKLDARYTLKTDDGCLIYVKSKGIYHPGHELQESPDSTEVHQSQADWFTRIQFEAGAGPYEWLNYIFAVGVFSMHEGKIIIDVFKMTNFPGEESRSIIVG